MLVTLALIATGFSAIADHSRAALGMFTSSLRSVQPAAAKELSAYLRLPVSSCGERVMTPEEAIRLAAELAPRAAVAGCFQFTVAAVGQAEGSLFLNSQADYRDQRSLNVRVLPAAAGQMRRLFDMPLEDALKGRPVIVRGTASRQRIDFLSYGRTTGKYYYQTHVMVGDMRQISRPPPAPF